MNMRRLSEYVLAKPLIHPFSKGETDSAVVEASANATNPIIDGYDGALFIVNYGGASCDETLDVAIEWASSGTATELAEITAATDAFFVQMDTDAGIYLLELDFRKAGMDAGVIGVGTTRSATATDCPYGVSVLLYNGTNLLPPTQDNTVVHAG